MILDSNALSEILSSCFTVSDFRYWITKPDFVFDPTKPLTWDDFEEEEFCVLPFTYSTANDDPLVIMDEPAKTFTTICDVPDRPQGHHIIYGEWGRGPGTYERFHGCIDVAFEGTPSPTSSAAPSPPPVTQAPTTSAAPSENLNGCCSQSFKSCDASYNGEDKETCESHGDSTGWLRKGAPTDNCLARWSGCNSAANTCCPGLTCSQISSSYSQCQYLPDAVPTPPTEPTPTPPTPTTPAPTDSPVTSSPISSPTSSSCGSGGYCTNACDVPNQAECFNRSLEDCLHFIENENKCAWVARPACT